MEENRITAITKEKSDVVRPAFAMAVDDDLLRKNPFDFVSLNLSHSLAGKVLYYTLTTRFLEK